MKVLVFGNPQVNEDSLALRILPKLRKRFPRIQFIEADPTEVLDYVSDEVWILDTAEGIEDVMLLDDISRFEVGGRFSVHDYDLTLDFKLLKKLGRVGKLRIIAIPMRMSKEEALAKVTPILSARSVWHSSYRDRRRG